MEEQRDESEGEIKELNIFISFRLLSKQTENIGEEK